MTRRGEACGKGGSQDNKVSQAKIQVRAQVINYWGEHMPRGGKDKTGWEITQEILDIYFLFLLL